MKRCFRRVFMSARFLLTIYPLSVCVVFAGAAFFIVVPCCSDVSGDGSGSLISAVYSTWNNVESKECIVDIFWMLLSGVWSQSSVICFFFCSGSSDVSNARIHGVCSASSCTSVGCSNATVLSNSYNCLCPSWFSGDNVSQSYISSNRSSITSAKRSLNVSGRRSVSLWRSQSCCPSCSRSSSWLYR